MQTQVHVVLEFDDRKEHYRDDNALFIDYGDYKRIVYKEDTDTEVVCDITGESVLMQRRGAWLTHAQFMQKEKGSLQVISDEGILAMEVFVKQFDVNDNGFEIVYDLWQEGQCIATNKYQCTWIKEANS